MYRLRIGTMILGLALGGPVAGMTVEQFSALPGVALLGLPVAGVLERCGLPAAITDGATAGAPRQTLRWRGLSMQLARTEWTVIYGDPPAHDPGAGWVNARPAVSACARGYGRLVLRGRELGVLRVTRRTDGSGYVTGYEIPADPFRAHRVILIDGLLTTPIRREDMIARYGPPDATLKESGTRRFRYWVVRRHQGQPDALHAVEFSAEGSAPVVSRLSIHTREVEFVQREFDALVREWERSFVLD